jgi:hypothetical protein
VSLPISSTRSVTLAWDESQGPDVAGYRIYYGTADGLYNDTLTLPRTNSVRITGLLPAVEYGFAATAFDSVGLESDPSEPVFYDAPGGPNSETPVDRFILLGTSSTVFYINNIFIGGATSTRPLQIRAFSSNQDLLPNPEIFYSFGQSLCTLTCRPRPGIVGSSIVTFLLNDGQITLSRTFLVVVDVWNEQPKFGPIEPVYVFEKTLSNAVPLSRITSGDPQSNQVLEFDAICDDPDAITDLVVHYTNPAREGWLTFTALSSRTLPVTVTVTVDDGRRWNHSFSREFLVYIKPAPPPVRLRPPPWRPFPQRPTSR